jgi:predicted dinucleotide-binding enzyme
MGVREDMSKKTVGIIGAGNIGQAMARIAQRAGREVILANSRGPESLHDVVEAFGPGVTAGTTEEAAAAPIVVLAVMWADVEAAVGNLTWSGQVVVDTTNALFVDFDNGVPTFTPASLNGRTSSEIVADLVPGAHVVKAGNTLPAERLGEDPGRDGGTRVIVISGDQTEANAEVSSLFGDAGFHVVNAGRLAQGGALHQVPDGPLMGLFLAEA